MTNSDPAAGDISRYSFLRVFANDHTIDESELAFIQRMAVRDAVVDADEREVLRRIFSRVKADSVTPEVWREIASFKAQHGIE